MPATLLTHFLDIAPALLPAKRKRLRVLLVEDNLEHAQLTRSLVENGPGRFEVSWKSTLLEAMEFLKSADVDVVLLDLGMPELCSWPSFIAIRGTAPGIPIVVLTADDDRETRRRLLHAGARYYLVKQDTDRDEICACLQLAART